jgi:hypothetical protein
MQLSCLVEPEHGSRMKLRRLVDHSEQVSHSSCWKFPYLFSSPKRRFCAQSNGNSDSQQRELYFQLDECRPDPYTVHDISSKTRTDTAGLYSQTLDRFYHSEV